MEGKSFSHRVRFLGLIGSCMNPLKYENCTILNLKFFRHQAIANLPTNGNEIVRFLKYERNFFLF